MKYLLWNPLFNILEHFESMNWGWNLFFQEVTCLTPDCKYCSKGPFALDDNDVFSLSCANSYIGDDATHLWRYAYNVCVCVTVAKCKRALSTGQFEFLNSIAPKVRDDPTIIKFQELCQFNFLIYGPFWEKIQAALIS